MKNFLLKDGAKLIVAGGRISESDVNNDAEGSAWLRRLQGLIIAHDPARSVEIIDKTASGQRFHDMRQRWDDDVIWHQPDLVCIILGLDDSWSHLQKQPEHREPSAVHEELTALIKFHKQACPDTQFVLIDQPFLSANNDPAWNTGQILERITQFHAALKSCAADVDAMYIPLQETVNKALALDGDLCFGGDEAHPNIEGSLVYALEVFKALGGAEVSAQSMLSEDQNIVFIGDSITDVGRRSLTGRPFGLGYMRLWRGLMRGRQSALSARLNMFNRGVGGNTIRNLQFRWDVDCLDLRPDHLVVKIGINDINRMLGGAEHTVTVKDYEEIMRELLTKVRDQNENCSITLISPFFLSRASNPINYRTKVLAALAEYITALKKVAQEFSASVVDLQELFQQHMDYRSAADFGSRNGIDIVHPGETGALIMAEALYAQLS